MNITIQEISMEGCASCAKTKAILREIEKAFPDVDLEFIDMASEKGQKMVVDFGIMSSPGIVVNGELFSSGGLNKDDLIKKLKELS